MRAAPFVVLKEQVSDLVEIGYKFRGFGVYCSQLEHEREIYNRQIF